MYQDEYIYDPESRKDDANDSAVDDTVLADAALASRTIQRRPYEDDESDIWQFIKPSAEERKTETAP